MQNTPNPTSVLNVNVCGPLSISRNVATGSIPLHKLDVRKSTCTSTFESRDLHYHHSVTLRSVFVGMPCAVNNFDKISPLPPDYSGFLSTRVDIYVKLSTQPELLSAAISNAAVECDVGEVR